MGFLTQGHRAQGAGHGDSLHLDLSCAHRLGLALAIFAFGLFGCAPKRQTIDMSKLGAQELIDLGLSERKDRKFGAAIAAFQKVTYDYAATRYAMEAQFELAETYRMKNDYSQAELEYEFLTTNFPNSQFAEEATFKTAMCRFRSLPKYELDQSGLQKTQDDLDLFRERYPNSAFLPQVESLEAEVATRYAYKEFQAALLYDRAGEYESGKVYLLHILNNWPKASLIPEVKLQLAIAYEKTGEPDKARAGYSEIAESNYDPELKRQAADRLARMK